MNCKKLYHLHIPRTSGFGIASALERTFSQQGHGLHKPTQEAIFSEETYAHYPYISGHFAKNPIVNNVDDFEVFSIVRDPVEHYLSIAAYVSSSTDFEMSNEYMDEFMYGNITPFGVNELFSNSGNIQSKMLFCRIAFVDKSLVSLMDDDVQNEKNIVFIENDMPNESGIKDLSGSMNLFSMQDRGMAIDWLRERVLKSHGLHLDESIHEITNRSKKNGFKPDISHIREIKRRSEIDEYLYGLVQER
jgi:hypothetical protein